MHDTISFWGNLSWPTNHFHPKNVTFICLTGHYQLLDYTGNIMVSFNGIDKLNQSSSSAGLSLSLLLVSPHTPGKVPKLEIA